MFSPEEYLARDQVISQFSQLMAKKKRGGTLEIPEADPTDDGSDNEDEGNEQIDEELESVQESDLQAEQHIIVDELINDFHEENMGEMEYHAGDYAIIQCGEKAYVGMVQAVDGELCHIKYMRRTGLYFGWLDDEHASWQDKDDIRARLSAPSIDRRGHYIFSKKDDQNMKLYKL
ncbi:uncharacterized protein LOC135495008 [Lineus longissimus]|uniref:uncharacterized protein LOC135495008 n=1 Tax=Lineus longissimus TaxID=88925 RepID=UPI00315CF7C3